MKSCSKLDYSKRKLFFLVFILNRKEEAALSERFTFLLHLRAPAARNFSQQPCLCPGEPRAERGPGASSNVTELWFCKVQNRRKKYAAVWSEN